jgi:hypothetical protein
MSQELKLSDELLFRIVQIIQESMLLGVDCTDLMRQIRVTPTGDEIVLTEQYKKQVKEMHNKWLENAAKIQEEQAKNEEWTSDKLILS